MEEIRAVARPSQRSTGRCVGAVPGMTMIADEIFAIYNGGGSGDYFGEAVTVTEHSLQAAHFAQSCDARESLILAALLHDIGHLIEPAPADIADWKTDAGHERSGALWLASALWTEMCVPQ